ncbi:cytochrome c [Bradyrhizobium pachyrhizi]|uniref:c-type cytochrome n=1 Tax=Bradyrhizobium TaxID=374 RepID=UPI00067D4A71|nr:MULTISPECIES: cytochrome c [Bradyrhizobium]WFU53567.1 cytochrome c [Bradyrhizobium pachyrhizi]WOH79375.1 cytochrome c [Bradyrhizobium sp. BEA-2-5]
MRNLFMMLVVIATTNLAWAQSELVKRGDYLVNGILACGNCHTPKGPNGDVLEKAFSGGGYWDEPPFTVHAANITQDKETGIGSWSDADIKKLLRTGQTPKGVHTAMVMPTSFYHILTENDLDAVVAYLRTITPVHNKVPDPIYKVPQVENVPPGGENPFAEPMMSDKVQKGFYLVTIAHCMACHTPIGPRGREYKSSLGAGGVKFSGPWGISVSRNITQNKTNGIGAWSDDEIKRAITDGVSRDGSRLGRPMGYHYYARISPDDLDAIVAYLRTVPGSAE